MQLQQTHVDTKTLWENTLSEIEVTVSKANFLTWFKDTFIVKVEDGVAFIGVPNAFAIDWMQNKFHKTILKLLRDQIGDIRAVEYSVAKKQDQENTQNQPVPSVYQAAPEGGSGATMSFSDGLVKRDDNLNPRYTFESFVIGPFNELAHAAAQAVIKQPGIVYNPLFIYGPTGRGKTHLIQAIGNDIKAHRPDSKVFYMTSEKFGTELVQAIQTNKVDAWKQKYRKYDVLIMDDVQFLSGKEKCQEELFHLFNILFDSNKQIVFSADVHPNFIPGLEDRLRSRFAQGMIVDVPTPDFESRVAIIRQKLEVHNVVLSDEIVDYLANTIDGNIREIEGAINAIACQSQLKSKELSLNEVKSLIKNNSRPKKMVSIEELVKIVADYYNISVESISDKTRRKEVVRPRQVTMYILREDFQVSFPTIGEKLGKRDHTTVIHSCDKIKNELKTDSALGQQIEQIRSML